MNDLLVPEHAAALAVIIPAVAVMVVAARRAPGSWMRVLAVVLVVDEVSWWIYLVAGHGAGTSLVQSLPLQLCDVAIFVAALALWTRSRLLVEVTYFWGLAGTVQALLTPDLPQHFPSYPYFQYYIAHGGVVAAALMLVIGLKLHPRSSAVLRVGAITVGYAAVVAAVDALTQSNYMYLRTKPPSGSLLDLLGPWPIYIFSAAVVGAVLFALLDAPFRFGRRGPSAKRRAEALR